MSRPDSPARMMHYSYMLQSAPTCDDAALRTPFVLQPRQLLETGLSSLCSLVVSPIAVSSDTSCSWSPSWFARLISYSILVFRDTAQSGSRDSCADSGLKDSCLMYFPGGSMSLLDVFSIGARAQAVRRCRSFPAPVFSGVKKERQPPLRQQSLMVLIFADSCRDY